MVLKFSSSVVCGYVRTCCPKISLVVPSHCLHSHLSGPSLFLPVFPQLCLLLSTPEESDSKATSKLSLQFSPLPGWSPGVLLSGWAHSLNNSGTQCTF